MILTDTGPLVGILDADDSNHHACITAMQQLPPESLLTTWPCFTEAMYLLGDIGGHYYQASLWRMQTNRKLIIHTPTDAEVNRMTALMAQYDNVPMDLADASLLALAESHPFDRIFSIDSDFYIYRLADGRALEVIR